MRTLTKKWARHFKPAIEKVISEYKEDNETGDCPLCVAAKTKCAICPWVVFEERKCIPSAFLETGIQIAGKYEGYNQQPIRGRIMRLRKWLKSIEQILEGTYKNEK